MQTLEMPAFTMREASKYLGIHEKTIYTWAREGRIEVTLDVTGQYRVPYGELWRLLRKREMT
jgi:excisionase family DNA binding protein